MCYFNFIFQWLYLCVSYFEGEYISISFYYQRSHDAQRRRCCPLMINEEKKVYLSSYEVCCFMDGQSPKENVRVSAPWVGVNLLLGKVLQIILFRASESLQWYPLLFLLPSIQYFSRLHLFRPTLAFCLVIFFVMWCSQSSEK